MNYDNLIRETAAKWLNKPVQEVAPPTQTVTYTLSEAIRSGTNKVQEKWQAEYAKTKKPIRVLLIEDVLGDKPADNQPPVVSKSIPDQQGKVGQSFTYEIPAGTFTDPDGSVSSISVKGLPNGIDASDRKLTGTPTASGEFTVTVTARDDRGAEVDAQFKLKVAPSEAGNQPPKVNQLIADQTGKVGQNFNYEIPSATFTDPDGSIASLSVKGLPEGVSLDGRRLTGTPTASGEFTVTVTARDDKGAEAATQFKFRVAQKDKEGGNQPPQVSQAIPDQQGKVGQPFAYEIAANTFKDPDGSIASLSAKGLPEGVTLADRRLSGSPTASGEFTVTITARDNGGAEVAAQFKFRVDAKEDTNVLPLVRKAIPDQQGKVGENFDYTISKETFFDPDGPIIDISVKDLPDGLSHSGWKLTGTPTASGEFTVTVTARDSRDATIATQFKISVAAKETTPAATAAQA